jgi:hypothetical protein
VWLGQSKFEVAIFLSFFMKTRSTTKVAVKQQPMNPNLLARGFEDSINVLEEFAIDDGFNERPINRAAPLSSSSSRKRLAVENSSILVCIGSRALSKVAPDLNLLPVPDSIFAQQPIDLPSILGSDYDFIANPKIVQELFTFWEKEKMLYDCHTLSH